MPFRLQNLTSYSHLDILGLPGFITLLHANIFLLFTFLHLWSQYFGILKKEGGKFIFLDSLIFIKIKNSNIKIPIIKSQNIKWKIERNKLYKKEIYKFNVYVHKHSHFKNFYFIIAIYCHLGM